MIFYSGILDIANEISKYILKKEGNVLVVVINENSRVFHKLSNKHGGTA
jgi:hypothetical protein